MSHSHKETQKHKYRRTLPVGYGLLLFITALSFCATGCYEPKVGCLDPNAVNFEVTADRDSGCIYPALRLKISHLHGTVGVSFDSIYANSLGQTYQIKDFAYYLSGFAALQGNQVYTLQDTFHAFQYPVAPATDSVFISPISDIGLIRRSVTDLTVGTFREIGSFNGMEADFGLRNELIPVLPGSVRIGSPLSNQSEMLYDSTNHQQRFMRLIMVRDPGGSAAVTDTLYFESALFAGGANKIKSTTPLIQRGGYNFEVKLAVNYQKWFAGTNLTQSKQEIKNQISQSLVSGFEFSQ